jgi:di/tricarboxylate transporter
VLRALGRQIGIVLANVGLSTIQTSPIGMLLSPGAWFAWNITMMVGTAGILAGIFMDTGPATILVKAIADEQGRFSPMYALALGLILLTIATWPIAYIASRLFGAKEGSR